MSSGSPDNRTIIVAGGGPVGMAAALELARRGYAPRIVDKEEGPAPLSQSRALAVNARSLTLLEPSGASAKIVADAQHIVEMRIRSRDRRLASIDLSKAGSRYTGIHGLAQGRTERILMDELKALGVEVEWETEAVLSNDDPEHPRVELLSSSGASETVEPDILVAADGAHSAIRKKLGIGFPGDSVPSTFFLADFRYRSPLDTSYGEAVFFNPGVLARLPVSADTLRYISTMETFLDLIDHPVPVAEIPWQSEFHVSFRHVDPMSKGKVFLVGDAAHIHSPVGGRGMNLGIEDACWLAWLISEGREREFSALRAATAATVLKQTHQMTDMILLKNPIATAARNFLLPLASHLPAVRNKMLRAISGGDTPAPPWLNSST